MLAQAVAEAREAGNAGHVVYAERVRQGITRLNQIGQAGGTPKSSPGGLGLTSPSHRPDLSHRSPSPQVESPVDRTLRKQKLQALKKK